MPVGNEWFWLSGTGRALDAWLGTGVDSVLVLAPAFAAARLFSRAPAVPLRRFRPTPADIAAFGLGLFGVLLLVELPRLYGVPESSFVSDLVPFAALFTVGAALSGRWRRRWLIVIVVPVLLTNDFMQWAVFRIPTPMADLLREILPLVFATALGASITPMRRAFARLESRPVEALIACNALNVVDALPDRGRCARRSRG